MTQFDTDIVVVGGGLVGLALACLLRAGQASDTPQVTVLEPRPPVAPGDKVGLRVSAFSPASRALLEQCAVWQSMPADRLAAYTRMLVWRDGKPGGSQSISFDAAEQGLAELGHIIENELVRWALWQRAEALGVQLLAGPEMVSAQRDASRVSLRLDNNRDLVTQLVVGADGGASRVREAFGLTVRRRAYGQRGVVTHVASELSHEATARQRFLADGPVALLPLADGRCSVVWSCPDAQAERLTAGGAEALGAALTRATQSVLGQLTVTEEPKEFPLVAAHAPRYCGERVVLVGDAAHQVHPLAGQGVNLGLLDSAQLAACLLAHARLRHADFGDARVLRRYERARKADNLLTLATMDLFHRVFSTGHAAAATLGGYGLAAADRLGIVKQLLARQALGGSGMAP